VKKYIIIAILFGFVFVWYLNNPITRLNHIYNIDLSIFNTKKISWDEEWNANGDGKVVGLLKITKKDFSKLSKICQHKVSHFSNANESILLKYKYVCSVKYKEENRDITLLLLLEDKSSKYLFYKQTIE